MSYEDAARDSLLILRERILKLDICEECKKKVLEEIQYVIDVIDEKKLEKLKRELFLD